MSGINWKFLSDKFGLVNSVVVIAVLVSSSFVAESELREVMYLILCVTLGVDSLLLRLLRRVEGD